MSASEALPDSSAACFPLPAYIDRRKRKQRQARSIPAWILAMMEDDQALIAFRRQHADALARAARLRAIRRAVATARPSLRETYRLLYVEKMRPATAARHLGITRQGMHSHQRQLHTRLRRTLSNGEKLLTLAQA